MRVIGIDISLTSTGFASLVTIGGHESLASRAIKTNPANTNPTLRQRHERARAIEDSITISVFDGPVPDLIVIEAPAYGARFGDPHDRSGLWWGVCDRLMRDGLPVVEVPPGNVKQYATGSGSTSGKTKVTKQMVISEVNRRYDLGPILLRSTENDRADAIVLAAIGARLLGHPIDPHIPAPNLRALTKIRLPEGITS